ncbi:MAG TPA: TIGR01777 family oxidoreductase [Acidimicrobiales bacterium]|nr:TIGR01777 family oxidoreductase [Acidimicrobiales bacterium]
MRVVVAGSSGLIGTALCRALDSRGHVVIRLVRRRSSGPSELSWEPRTGQIDEGALEGVDALVNLAGAGIGDRRWSAGRRRLLVSSRIDSTSLLARTLASLEPPPRVLVNASAVGIYGNRGDEVLDEHSEPGDGFLAGLCRQWEASVSVAAQAGIRTVLVRSGVVLSASGGALARQLPLFRLGLGGRLGNGSQWLSWISLEDEVRVLLRAIDDDGLSGPVNSVAPQPVTNRQFTTALGRALQRPAVLAVPPPALRLVLGRGLVDDVLLASQRVRPAALQAVAHGFAHGDLDTALAALLNKRAATLT